MDWNAAIDRNREALKRVLAALVTMATGGARPVGPTADGRLPIAATLPRRLHRAILRLLRPAEAAARRLVIVAAREIEVDPAPPRHGARKAHQAAAPRSAGGFRLFDPLSTVRLGQPRRVRNPPRISVPGVTYRRPVPPTPRPWDQIDAAPIARRLSALAAALDDLPRHAMRFARWRARAARQEPVVAPAGRPRGVRRYWPLRPGRPPGRRSSRDRSPEHEVHVILFRTHDLARWTLAPPDTT